VSRSVDRRSPSHYRETNVGNLNQDQDGDGLHEAGLLKAIAESPGAAHFVADVERFLYVNPGFASLTGYGRAEPLSMEPGPLFAHEWSCLAPAAGDDSPLLLPLPKGGWGGFWDKLQQPVDGEDTSKGQGVASLRFETRITTKAGAEKWVP
jgi:PAS domain-containing protein